MFLICWGCAVHWSKCSLIRVLFLEGFLSFFLYLGGYVFRPNGRAACWSAYLPFGVLWVIMFLFSGHSL